MLLTGPYKSTEKRLLVNVLYSIPTDSIRDASVFGSLLYKTDGTVNNSPRLQQQQQNMPCSTQQRQSSCQPALVASGGGSCLTPCAAGSSARPALAPSTRHPRSGTAWLDSQTSHPRLPRPSSPLSSPAEAPAAQSRCERRLPPGDPTQTGRSLN